MADKEKVKKVAARLQSFHFRAMIFWTLFIIPAVWFWSQSVLLVQVLSIYAIVVSHWGAWQASRAEIITAEIDG